MQDQLVWENGTGIVLKVIVRPSSKERELFASFSETEILINLNSPARGGKANTELVKRLSKLLGVSSSDVSIISGHRGRDKTIHISGVTKDHLIHVISQTHKR